MGKFAIIVCLSTKQLQENIQLSNDRLWVRSKQASHLPDVESTCIIDQCVKVGELCIFKRVDNPKFLLGKIAQFSYLDGNKKY